MPNNNNPQRNGRNTAGTGMNSNGTRTASGNFNGSGMPKGNNKAGNGKANANAPRNNSAGQVRYSVKQTTSMDDGTKTYEFSINGGMRRPYNSSTPQYVLDKNGRRIEVHSKAEYQRIRLERERAVKAEHRRMLEEAALHKAEENMKTVKLSSFNWLSAKFWISAIVCTLLFMVIILNFVSINERNREISALENEISALEDEKNELEEEIEQKNDLIYIEDYATNVLGMVKADRLSRMYVSIDTKDKIELSEGEDDSDEITSSDVFGSILNKIKALWEKLN